MSFLYCIDKILILYLCILIDYFLCIDSMIYFSYNDFIVGIFELKL